MNTIEKVDDLIKSLSKDEQRKLMTLIRKYYVTSSDMIKWAEENRHDRTDRIKSAEIIIPLYKKAGVIEEDWKKHWGYYRTLQISLHYATKKMAKPERKDNKDYINYGGSHSCDNYPKIRFPKKCRKTAWKRFYRLFPNRKPKEDGNIS